MNIVVCDNYKKEKLLKEYSKKRIINDNKFYTFKELKKKLFFDYDYKTLEYIIKKYKVNINIAKIYVENMYYLMDVDTKKIKFLNELKNELISNNLLKIDNRFRNFLKNKEIVVYKDSLTKEELHILKGFKYRLISKENEEYEHVIYESSTIEEEIEFVLRKIKELISKGVSLNNIKLIINNEYNKHIVKYFNLFEVPINMDLDNTYLSTIVSREFLSLTKCLTISDAIERLREKYDVSDLVKIINKSSLVSDDVRLDFIINDLSNYKIRGKTYNNAVSITSLDNYFDSNDYVFLLGFNIGAYPYTYLDDDYLSDKEKMMLNLDTSVDKNKIEKEEVIKKIKRIPNLVITYKLFNDKVCYKSVLCEEVGDIQKIEIDESISYSKILSELKYARDLDNLYKYNEESKYLGMYQNNLDIKYRGYNNSYTMIDNNLLKENLSNGITLSYTSLEAFNECKFKYYLSKIMNLNIYEDSFKTIIGNITHHILEIGIKKDIDIEEEIASYIKDIDFKITKRELFYLSILKEELEFVLNYLKEMENSSSLLDYSLETEVNVIKEYDEVVVNFKGFIDKIMKCKKNGEDYIALVDYKTGDKNISLDLVEYGINIQLPIYLYLIKKSHEFKNAHVVGFYLERVLQNILSIDPTKKLDARKKENLRLNGYTNSDIDVIKLLDSNYELGTMIKGLRVKKDGSFYSSSKVLSEEEMDELVLYIERLVDSVISDITKGDFRINPKVYNGKNISCMYCHFKDICFKTKENEEVIGGEDNESDNRTSTGC